MSSAMKKQLGSTLKPRLSVTSQSQNLDDISDQEGLLGEAKDVPRAIDGKSHMRRGSRNGGSTSVGSTPPLAVSRQFFVLSYLQLCIVVVLVVVFGVFYYLYSGFVPKSSTVETSRTLPTPEILTHHCREHIGPPRVEQVTDSIWVAIGYDLANTILIKTSAGHVVVDVAMSPVKSRIMKAALFEKAGQAPIHSIVYTHSHIDHVGGATGWAEPDTKIWATEALAAHFFKQYGVFRKTEMLRGSRQYGADVAVSELPCSALGARVDLKALAGEAGFLMPTNTFSGSTKFQVGEEEFELVEAHGETHDQLFVWLPRQKAMLPGDNYYQAFPNLYTIRGTTPRPVRDWIRSLDEMRALVPEYMVPSHTAPVIGRDAVQKQLTDYRDAIAWIFAETIRGANEGRPVDELASSVGLPPHLRENDALDELYGQIDWSVRAIYSNELGWFDGEPEDLYPMALDDEAHRMVQLMGGAQRIMGAIRDAQKAQDHTWALRLIKLLRAAAPKDASVVVKSLDSLEATSLSSLGKTIYNTNGRAYLLQAAIERSGAPKGREAPPSLSDALIDAIPIDLFFEVMATRLRPELSIESHESALFKIGPHNYVVTIRRGVAEIIKGDKPLYGTPDLIGTLIADEKTFRRLGLSQISPASAIMSGSIKVEGDQARFLQFFLKFQRGV